MDLSFPFDAQQVGLMREYADASTDQGQLASYLTCYGKENVVDADAR